MHLGSSGQLTVTAPDAPIDVMITLQPINICQAAADLVWSRVFKEFPDAARRALRGRHRLDPVLPRPPRPHLRHAPRVDRPGLRRPHSRPTCSASTSSRASSPTRSASSSATTSASTTCAGSRTTRTPTRRGRTRPRSSRRSPRSFDVSDAEVNKITHENAMRWYRFDPFAHRPREQCTVGALRAEVPGHDVAIRAMDKGRFAGHAHDDARRARRERDRLMTALRDDYSGPVRPERRARRLLPPRARAARPRVPAARPPPGPRRHPARARAAHAPGHARRRDRGVDGGEPALLAAHAARAQLRQRRRADDLQEHPARHRRAAPVHGLPVQGRRRASTASSGSTTAAR